ncbi:hypothetical protein K450DRAFT_222636 [Umbelopsis ramanniana AG]|uniref:Uncharacterized protein n=1 Tax=Umbelopsis ramanniana AG TaxID=1314678 RepID=A0AAD5EE38_UMBRA|nr:uncharacterized protein K450DRAFT_262695 [Umbelopsis ramanniana AG]XP_051440696.1 uncharacterized protein K450DRAFT_260350 [Umbelopsis ramanniana AG]XP_051440867.1 uncharacterized protein K450DRAFT_259504 [Umbelopsis ramanniana AG]XP_051440900.1 uncharacterized protein K450DRAFT_259723 [Umbelopsis ramanniana AG]XP_051447197.1 uncharacterized protein K450DRAFT_227866 [Umbelopsis ramanniana AG]XP_051448755.1 uncharacterized protein K450DRAFT_222636 [Umbelopsis ramanniana AG]KAI8575261.1 hypo
MEPHYSCVRNDTQLLVGGMRTRMWWPPSQTKERSQKIKLEVDPPRPQRRTCWRGIEIWDTLDRKFLLFI